MGNFQVDQPLAKLLVQYKLAVIGDEHVPSEMAVHEPETDLVSGGVAEHDHEPAGTIGSLILVNKVGGLVRQVVVDERVLALRYHISWFNAGEQKRQR
ncbi:hypothetical protein D3C77_463830 [compost metagenome]